MEPNVLSLEEKLDPRHSALVVVDVQNVWCHPSGAQIQSGLGRSMMDSMRNKLGLMLESARQVGTLIIFVRAIHDQTYVSPVYAEQLRKQGTYGKVLLNTWDADYWGDIRPSGQGREIELLKHRYSAFYGTELDLILRSNGIKTLLMTGVATGGCVYTTAVDGFFRDYYVIMVPDACADGDEQTHDVFLKRFGYAYGDVISAPELVEIWSSKTAHKAALG